MQIWNSYDLKHLKVHHMQIEVCHVQPNGFMRFSFLVITSILIDKMKTLMPYFHILEQNCLVADQFLKFGGQGQAIH